MLKESRYSFPLIGWLLSGFWRVVWFLGGLAILFLWNGYSPKWAVMLLPLYMIVWIGALPLGHMFIEWVAKNTIGKWVTTE